ncbi:MAG: hypothetical protein R3B97_06080 [Dehalococcoidia bacterium]|nr:hypothetical protein [Dehalococcoidia bacterium]MCB9486346.1 hypothetical protein [Thermoflexaceae bacterium]
MLFPKDRPIFPVLRTSFTRFDILIDELASEGATGCLAGTFAGCEGAILFLNGTPAASLFSEGTKRFTGPEAARKIHAAAGKPGGLIEVYGLEEAVLQGLVRGLDAVPLYENLSTDFASPDRLFARLREDGHSGHVDVHLASGNGEAMIMFEEGSIVRAVLVSEGKTYAGVDVADSVVQLAANHGATLSVYRTATEAVPESSPMPPPPAPIDPADLATFWTEMLTRAERVIDGIGGPGRFEESFNEVVAERGTIYPYLSPDARLFGFVGGAAMFSGEPPDDVSGVLDECLLDTLARLAFRLKRADLESRVLAEVADLHERHPEFAAHLPARARSLAS